MRRVYFRIVLTVFASFALGLTGCGGSDSKSGEPKKPDKAPVLLKKEAGGAGAPKAGNPE